MQSLASERKQAPRRLAKHQLTDRDFSTSEEINITVTNNEASGRGDLKFYIFFSTYIWALARHDKKVA